MEKICIFAGTTEGRDLAMYLSDKPCSVTACVATEYGEISLENTRATIKVGRLDKEEMESLLRQEKFDLVIDTTHPFAQVAQENILASCTSLGVEYMRINRQSEKQKGFCNIEEAIEHLKATTGNILLTTGSKDISKFSVLPDFAKRVYARVLPVEGSIKDCKEAGLEASHIIGMQGSFSEDMNIGMINFLKIKTLVTKNSGGNGGFFEKLSAAEKTNTDLVVINPPKEAQGVTFAQGILAINKRLGIEIKPTIAIIGMGTGSKKHMTQEAIEALEDCQVIIGAKRLTESYKGWNKPIYNSFLAKDIIEILKQNPEYQRIAVVMSGDVGFYSGAKKLYEGLKDFDIKTVCGISTPVYLCSKLKLPWDDIKLLSLHGKQENLVHYVKTNKRVFALVGGEDGAQNLCKVLCEYGFEGLTVYVGENLASENERITKGTAKEFSLKTFATLSAVIIENSDFSSRQHVGIADEEFERVEAVPMTKQEIRAVSIAKLKLSINSIVYDIGAGTGSVSVECALNAFAGRVYAIEKNEKALAAILKNKHNFKLQNLEIVNGYAPQILEELETPTHAFIGGSSGNMEEIFDALLKKNSNMRIVINTIALESLSQAIATTEKYGFTNVDIVQINSSKSKKLGRYNMMTAQNPIYIISCQKGNE